MWEVVSGEMGDGRTLPVRCGQDGEISTKTPIP